MGLLKKEKKYKGHLVIEDNNLESAKGKDVLEQTSNGNIIIRHYDENGVADNNYREIDLAHCPNNIMKVIHKQVGGKDFLISESALDLIIELS